MIRLALHGARGKMGTVLAELIRTEFREEFTVVESFAAGECDGIIDFTSAEGLSALVSNLSEASMQTPTPFLVTGSTGFNDETRLRLQALAMNRPVLWSANFSPGVHLLRKALRAMAGNPLLREFEVTQRDLHHVQKRDAPSGTALILRDSLGAAMEIESIREGTTVGRHEVRLESSFETVEFIHDAKDRKLFARGALLVARELARAEVKRPPELLSLDHLFP